ncbi:MAG: hypothetical protein U1C47_02340 [Hydrogenophaga sp.]|nr:hypothetical protein [Hydrogenophaga sp.]
MELNTMESLSLATNQDGPSALMSSLGHDPGKVAALESLLLQGPNQIELETLHLIHAGMYARTIFIPAGTVLTGALIDVANICTVCGDITVTTSDVAKRFTGYHVIPASAGHKRAGFAHADTWWTTLVRTDLKDVPSIENDVTREADRLYSRRVAIEQAQRCAIEQGETK